MFRLIFILSFLLVYQISEAQKIKEETTYHDNGKIESKGYKSYYESSPPVTVGYWTFYYPNGNKKLEGEFKNGKIIGPWKAYYENGQKRLDAFFEVKRFVVRPGYMEPVWVEESLDFKLADRVYDYASFCVKEWTSYWDDGKPACKYTFTDDCDNLRVTEIINTRKNPKFENNAGGYSTGEMVLSDLVFKPAKHDESSCKYKSGYITYLNDLFNKNGSFKRYGIWSEYDSSGILKNKSPYEWQTNTINGIVEFYYASGKIKSKQTFVDSKKYGPAFDYFESNGKIKASGILVDNEYNGIWVHYYENGNKKSEITYECDEKHGNSIFYYPNGKIKSRGLYDKDRMVENWVRYYENGNVKSEEYYNYDEALEGVVKYYYPSERILAKEEWSNGKLVKPIVRYDSLGNKILTDGNGVMMKYHDNGVLYQYTEYKNYCRDGITKFYYDNGQLEVSFLHKYDANNSPIGLRMEILSSFHKDGRAREKGTLKDGNGTWIQYNDKGEIENVKHFTNGIENK